MYFSLETQGFLTFLNNNSSSEPASKTEKDRYR